MLELFIELKLSVDTINVNLQEARAVELRTVFNVGNTRLDFGQTVSDSQSVFLISILQSRLVGAKLLESEDLIESCDKDLAEFIKAYKHQSVIINLMNDLAKERELYYECEDLLSVDEKREMFKDKAISHKASKVIDKM